MRRRGPRRAAPHGGLVARRRARVLRLLGAETVFDVQHRYAEVRGSALAASITLYLFLAIFA